MNINRLTWIGITVFFAILSFFYGVRFLQDEAFQKSNFTFNVVFNDLQGLDISDDVRMLGKRIGRVSGTRIVGQKIAVELTIDNTFAFRIPIIERRIVVFPLPFGPTIPTNSPLAIFRLMSEITNLPERITERSSTSKM